MSADTKVYVGNLPQDVRQRDLEDLFEKYGKILNINLKNGRDGPPFAFVEFEDKRDADDALRSVDGYKFQGSTLRVALPHKSRTGQQQPQQYGNRSGDRMQDRGRGGFSSARGSGRPRHFRLHVSGLPVTGSWQDLKDHMRDAGEIAFVDVFRDGTGVVNFLREEDGRRAMKKYDNSKFCSRDGHNSVIRIHEDSKAPPARGGGNRSRSRSRSPSGNGEGGWRKNRRPSPSAIYGSKGGRSSSPSYD